MEGQGVSETETETETLSLSLSFENLNKQLFELDCLEYPVALRPNFSLQFG